MTMGPQIPDVGDALTNAQMLQSAVNGIALHFRADNLSPIEVRGTPAAFFAHLPDTRLARRITFVIKSTLDVNITVQAVGAEQDLPDQDAEHLEMGSSISVTTTAKIGALTINLDDEWLPFVGLRITPAGAASSGQVSAVAYLQEWGGYGGG